MRHAMFLMAIPVTGCGGPAAQAPAPVAAQPVVVDFAFHGEGAHGEGAPPGRTGAGADACCAPEARPTRDQPPEVKLKLGHYQSPRFGIGLVIDRTGDDAKVRFDGTDRTIRLFPQYFWHRTEYHRAQNDKVLEVRNNGHVILYMEGAGEGIWVFRDGDADPL